MTTEAKLTAEATALISRIEQAPDRILIISQPTPQVRKTHRQLIHAARQHRLVPAGFTLLHTGRDRGDIVLHLAADDDRDRSVWATARYRSRHEVTALTEINAKLETGVGLHIVHDDMRDEAIALAKCLVAKAISADFKVVVRASGKLLLHVGRQPRRVTISQEYDSVPHVPTDEEKRRLRRKPWPPIPEIDRVPARRLHIVMNYGYNQRDEWNNIKPGTYPRTVRSILAQITEKALADEAAREEANRQVQAQQAEWQRQEDQQRQQWQEALANARPKAVEQYRIETFMSALDAWRTATLIRQFCSELRQAEGIHETAGDLQAWINFGQALADTLHPLGRATRLEGATFDRDLEPDDLRPFLDGWSPTSPHRPFTATAPPAPQPTDAHRPWHPGMRGQWWRR